MSRIVVVAKLLITTGVALVGCTQGLNVTIRSEVPVALVQTLPVAAAVYFSDDLRGHRYTEDNDERSDWVIESGDSQVAMFQRVLTSTFDRVIVLQAPPSAETPSSFGLNIVPEISEMQFATPAETSFEFYEAWIRYAIVFVDASGEKLDEWTITAYGKAPKRRFSLRADGIDEAIGLALRDAGAKLSTELPAHPLVQQALAP